MSRIMSVASAILLTLFVSLTAAAQQPPPKSYTPKQMRELGSDYKTLQKQLQQVEKERAALEATVRSYNEKMKQLADQMGRTEDKIDFASGIYSYDPRFETSTQQAQALHMAYELKSADLISHISAEKFQLEKMKTEVTDKYNKMKQFKGK